MNPKKLRTTLLLCCVGILTLCYASHAQVLAGINANGRAMVHGDTINICRGSSILYESTAQGSPIINWRFKNGLPSTASGAGPFSITYNTNGFDTTFQTVGTGVFADSMFIIVRVDDVKTNVGFDFLPNNACGNETIQFTNTSINGEPYNNYWEFGDGSVSMDQNPTHQFLSAVGSSGTQTFQVKLIVTNSSFCTDSISKTITIRSVPDATITKTDPLVTVVTYNDLTTFRYCEGDPQHNFKFDNASTTTAINTSYNIKWGDGTPDTTFANWPAGNIINHTFPEGNSLMTVSVTGTSGCIGIKKYNVYVGTFPYGRLNATGSNSFCVGDSMSINLTDIQLNSAGTSYLFYINDGSESQVFQHPPPAIIGHRFTKSSCSSLSDNGTDVFTNAFGGYILIQNACGVASANVVPIYVSSKPIPAINTSVTSACTNSNVTIINTSSFGDMITPTGGATSLCEQKGKNVWSITPSTGFILASGTLGSLNGNSTNQAVWTDAADTLDIQFTNAGVYTIKIYVGNARCGMDSTVTTVCIRNPPQAAFTMSKQYSCGPAVVDFTNTSPLNQCPVADDKYLWNISYDDPMGCANAGDPTYSFINGTTDTTKSPSLSFTAAGRYIIQLSVKSIDPGIGCTDGILIDTFYVNGPLKTNMPALPSVCVANNIFPVVEINSCYSTGPLGYQWTFTGGSPATSTDSLPGSVSYAAPGTFPIQLIITDSSCMSSTTVNTSVTVMPLPNTIVGNDTTICSGETLSLGGAAVAGVTYQWSPVTGLDDATSANPQVTLTYNGSANDTVYTYYSVISQGANCTKTDSIKITVKPKPIVTVIPASAEICNGSSVILTASGATSYAWTPADSLNSTTTAQVIAKPITPTIYTVRGTLANGCFADQSVTVTTYESPVADFDLSGAKICTGETLSVTNKSLNATSYDWQWGDGSTSTFESGQHVYATPGNYNITLVTQRTDVSGFVCTDTIVKSVEVINKIPAQITVAPGSNCAPYTLQANAVNTTGATLVEWIIYDSSAVPNEIHVTGVTATHVFDKPGSYSITLIVQSAAGCADTAYHQFVVLGTPVSVLDPALTNVCGNDTTITFTATTISGGDDTIIYKWYVDNQLEGSSNLFTHQFTTTAGNTTPKEFNIRLEAQNGGGCGQASSVTGKVILNPIPDPDIQVSPALVQQQPNYEFMFRDNAPSNPNMIYTWYMGDRSQQTRDGQQVTYQYGDTGTYKVTLVVKDYESGCTGTDTVSVTILYVPGYIQVPNAICPGCSNQSVRYFLPLAKGLKKYRLTIYTTLGQKIFETTSLDADGSPNVPWDGTLNGKVLQQDVYSWQIEGQFRNGSEWKGMMYPGKNKPVKAGFITVIK